MVYVSKDVYFLVTHTWMLFPRCKLDAAKNKVLVISTVVLLLNSTVDGMRELPLDFNSGVISKTHTRWQQKVAFPSDYTQVLY